MIALGPTTGFYYTLPGWEKYNRPCTVYSGSRPCVSPKPTKSLEKYHRDWLAGKLDHDPQIKIKITLADGTEIRSPVKTKRLKKSKPLIKPKD